MARRSLLLVILFAASLHGLGIARSSLPAQDGLKYIRVARQFQTQPWPDVVRNTDRHPLYPAAIAVAQPTIALLTGPGPTSWRIAAQGISALASIALLISLYSLTRALFDQPTAALATLLYVLLPLPAEVGHDTLSDALALSFFTLAVYCGERALRCDRLGPALGCGIAAGFGFLTRPEVALVPLAVLVTACTRLGPWKLLLPRARRCAAVAIAFLFILGSYSLIKGEVSEKLSMRRGAALSSRHDSARKSQQPLPSGLNDPRWDFSAKEEWGAPARMAPLAALERVFFEWVEGMGWFFALMAVWGAVRVRITESASWGRRLTAVYIALFGTVLVRHATTLGYLSGRHILSLVVVSMPWAAAGSLLCARRFADLCHWSEKRRRIGGVALVALVVVAGVTMQAKAPHPSRWGHWAAGRWLTQHAGPADAVLDTRGWAAFVSGCPSYDYWHVRQALTDARLAFVVVGADELSAQSPRADTLRAILSFAARPVAAFPEREGGTEDSVQIFQFERPESWEGLRP
jgi:4-amino-4-deoxy-L-arabinose transferase-like glycosyltransferase